jgi:hypothetical protein
VLFLIGNFQPGIGMKGIPGYPHVDAAIMGYVFRKKRSGPIIRMHDYGYQTPRVKDILLRRNELMDVNGGYSEGGFLHIEQNLFELRGFPQDVRDDSMAFLELRNRHVAFEIEKDASLLVIFFHDK